MKKNLFNEDAMSLDTYIMVKLKEKTAQLRDKLTQKSRAPISLSMGAPTANPPQVLIEKLKEFSATVINVFFARFRIYPHVACVEIGKTENILLRIEKESAVYIFQTFQRGHNSP